MKFKEIERKWLLDSFPDLPVESQSEMEQGYLAFFPNTVRIRMTKNRECRRYMLCIKNGKGLLRTEVETEITQEQYQALKDILAAPAVLKTQKTYRLAGGELLECNQVDPGAESGFCYAEVEFDTVQQAERFTPPPFLGPEVTGEKKWTMASYCETKAQTL